MSPFIANRVMGLALQLEQPNLAVDLFETVFAFPGVPSNPAASALKLFREDSEEVDKIHTYMHSYIYNVYSVYIQI